MLLCRHISISQYSIGECYFLSSHFFDFSKWDVRGLTALGKCASVMILGWPLWLKKNRFWMTNSQKTDKVKCPSTLLPHALQFSCLEQGHATHHLLHEAGWLYDAASGIWLRPSLWECWWNWVICFASAKQDYYEMPSHWKQF